MDVQAFERQALSGTVDAVIILSNEGDIYTAEVVIHGRSHTLESTDSHQPLVFHSYREAKRSFASYSVPIRLEASQVYDEMIRH
ncbi:DUF6482 family protein [Motiliproteus sp.]|uniref:DUF6482 family protein n=1 Tax=Motiliproteus sp. TaxID=1898955 RepID=UPI003BAA45A2